MAIEESFPNPFSWAVPWWHKLFQANPAKETYRFPVLWLICGFLGSHFAENELAGSLEAPQGYIAQGPPLLTGRQGLGVWVLIVQSTGLYTLPHAPPSL